MLDKEVAKISLSLVLFIHSTNINSGPVTRRPKPWGPSRVQQAEDTQGPYPHGVLLGRQTTSKRTNLEIDISVMTVISTIRECTRGWQWPVYLPSWYLGSPLQQANLSCSLTEGRAPITGRAQGDVFQGEGKTTGPKEGTYRGS